MDEGAILASSTSASARSCKNCATRPEQILVRASVQPGLFAAAGRTRCLPTRSVTAPNRAAETLSALGMFPFKSARRNRRHIADRFAGSRLARSPVARQNGIATTRRRSDEAIPHGALLRSAQMACSRLPHRRSARQAMAHFLAQFVPHSKMAYGTKLMDVPE